MIEVHGLTKKYGAVRAVHDVSFRLEAGVINGFVGPNGAGKSTTIRMMVGLDRPTSGHCLIDGRPYARLAAPLRAVGALLDVEAIHPGRSGRDHLRILARTHGIGARRADELLEMVGLVGSASRRVGGYSLGMRQRLGLAAALLGDPAALLLDEPANGLDPDGIIWIRSLLRGLAREGRAILVSSHLMGELAQTVDRLIVLGRGRVLADASLAELVSRNATRVVHTRTEQPDRLELLLREREAAVARRPDGSCEVTGMTADEVAVLAHHAGILLYENTTVPASLEDAYLTLTRGNNR
ncbi:ATP-binding cassette domain-containing protein [Actinoplanes couchii]|uniref:ABC transporter ATPase n=1 Tax=Actinoplanes couchii TaxID=403638 RepID=A0ABQ3X8S5_9ACTN|nr:ATP-binding cassette domain-containing protein [Actinoplanes couchii]MDR6320161.1 ABC-2 type transport system ATP-binding protein [Actinoplanes couchii]GID54825.1 ABC transporter ATPase [Actinoplanes couchii]